MPVQTGLGNQYTDLLFGHFSSEGIVAEIILCITIIIFYKNEFSTVQIRVKFVIARAILFSLVPPARAGVPEAIPYAKEIASPPEYKSGGSQ
jgi:hypothetical protein